MSTVDSTRNHRFASSQNGTNGKRREIPATAQSEPDSGESQQPAFHFRIMSLFAYVIATRPHYAQRLKDVDFDERSRRVKFRIGDEYVRSFELPDSLVCDYFTPEESGGWYVGDKRSIDRLNELEGIQDAAERAVVDFIENGGVD